MFHLNGAGPSTSSSTTSNNNSNHAGHDRMQFASTVFSPSSSSSSSRYQPFLQQQHPEQLIPDTQGLSSAAHALNPSRPDVIDYMMRTGSAAPSGTAGMHAHSPTSAQSRTMHGAGNDMSNFNQWFNQPGPPRNVGGVGAPTINMPSPTSFSPTIGVGSPQENQSGKKKKRRADGESPSVEEKRTKTGRACDACRSKKIRCDILPTDATTNGDAQPICAHCKQYNIECTFFLPITETRFKKRRAAAEDGATPAGTKTNGAATPQGAEKPSAPTSIPFLLHASAPTQQFEQYDISNHSHWEVTEDASGQIRVEATLDSGDKDTRLDRYVLPGPIMSALVNKYFEWDNEFIPVVSRSEFVATSNPHPLLLYAMCARAAVGREYPRHVFQRLRGLVNGLIRCNEILSHPKMEHIQAMLIIAPTGEIHAQPNAPTASAAMMRFSCAIRMAQDLGLHREAKTQPKTVAEMVAVETRRRVWAACVFLDAWITNSLGVPMMIDVHDCDVLVPSPLNIVPGLAPASWPVNEGYLTLNENVKLALISGKIVKLMYGPTGMTHTTDQQLQAMLDEMSAFRDGIPEALRFKGNESSFLSAFLHFLFTSVQFLFWRSFIRVASPPPAHLKLFLDAHRWAELVKASRAAIEWLNVHDKTLDTLFLVPYTATSCALIQYHTWARRRDPAALETLKLIRDVVSRWEEAVQPDQMSIRRKSCETMKLLYEAALKTNPEGDDRTDGSEGTPVSARSIGDGTKAAMDTPAFPSSRRPAPVEIVNDGEGDGPTLVEYSHAPETAVAMFDQPTDIDVSFLDSIPDSNFDWSGWGQYFETVERMFPTVPAEIDGEK